MTVQCSINRRWWKLGVSLYVGTFCREVALYVGPLTLCAEWAL